MIGITFNVENVNTVLQVYDQIQAIKYEVTTSEPPETPIGPLIALTDWSVVSGTESYPFPINLITDVTQYTGYDPDGVSTDWYSSRYYNSLNGSYSAWSAPVLGNESDLYYDPTYPAEDIFDDEDQAIIAKLRIYIGDPKGLCREFGEEALASLHPDYKTYELSEKGWPVAITMGGKTFNSISNPVVNGYRYLKFQEPVNDVCYSCLDGDNLCGDADVKLITMGVDVWYHTFRNSDKELLAAYDACFPPIGLTEITATTQAYVLQTAVDILTKELIEDATEDGAIIGDDKTDYNPESGLAIRKDLLDSLKNDLDNLIKSLKMADISGVLID